jgi:ribonucleoside-diphosphate reductase alpha chain
MGHIKMMAATQPFLSGAISKTVNLPNDCSVDDIAEAYMEAWRQGLKAVAIYRDGSKGTQPLNVSAPRPTTTKERPTPPRRAAASSPQRAAAELPPPRSERRQDRRQAADRSWNRRRSSPPPASPEFRARQLLRSQPPSPPPRSRTPTPLDSQAPPRAVRHRLPAERASRHPQVRLAGHEGYITVGLYPNGQPGEIFIRMAKEGSTVSGLMDSFATAISLALQHGVPLKVLCEKFAHTRFEPSGWTGNEQIGYAKSIMDYIFRWIQIRFLSGQPA